MNTKRRSVFFKTFFLRRVMGIIHCLSLSCLLGLTSCAPVPRERLFDDFVIVRAEAEDSFSSLAAEYLNDPKKAWQIDEFNHMGSPTPGQELVIPFNPFNLGGLKADGFQTVPILTYYGFSASQTGKLIVSETAFKKQMKYLKDNGYHVITLDQFLDFLDFKKQIPEKSVVITLDGCNTSHYDIAYPVLKGYDFPATLFVYTDLIDGRKTLSWERLNEMVKKGVDVQSKAQTHRNLARMSKGESFKEYFESVQKEISHSKKRIEKKLNRECRYMAYPHGETNDLVISILKKEGYRGAFTDKGGANPFFAHNYMIKRCVIGGRINMEQFKNNLTIFSKIELK